MATSKEINIKIQKKYEKLEPSYVKRIQNRILKAHTGDATRRLLKAEDDAKRINRLFKTQKPTYPTYERFKKLKLDADKELEIAMKNQEKAKRKAFGYLRMYDDKLKRMGEEIKRLKKLRQSELEYEAAEKKLGKVGAWIKKGMKGKGKIALAVAGTGALATGAAYARYKYLEKQRQSKKLAKESLKLWEQYFIE